MRSRSRRVPSPTEGRSPWGLASRPSPHPIALRNDSRSSADWKMQHLRGGALWHCPGDITTSLSGDVQWSWSGSSPEMGFCAIRSATRPARYEMQRRGSHYFYIPYCTCEGRRFSQDLLTLRRQLGMGVCLPFVLDPLQHRLWHYYYYHHY